MDLTVFYATQEHADRTQSAVIRIREEALLAGKIDPRALPEVKRRLEGAGHECEWLGSDKADRATIFRYQWTKMDGCAEEPLESEFENAMLVVMKGKLASCPRFWGRKGFDSTGYQGYGSCSSPKRLRALVNSSPYRETELKGWELSIDHYRFIRSVSVHKNKKTPDFDRWIRPTSSSTLATYVEGEEQGDVKSLWKATQARAKAYNGTAPLHPGRIFAAGLSRDK